MTDTTVFNDGGAEPTDREQLAELHVAALPADAPGAWIRDAIDRHSRDVVNVVIDVDGSQADVVELLPGVGPDPVVVAQRMFPHLDIIGARVQGRLAAALNSLTAAQIEAGREPRLRADVDELLVDAREFILAAFREVSASQNRRVTPGPVVGGAA